MLTEVYTIPKDLKPREVKSIYRNGENFSMVWIRNGEMFGCKNLKSLDVMSLIFACKDEIRNRPNPEDRIEHWECIDENGTFSFKMYISILESRKNG